MLSVILTPHKPSLPHPLLVFYFLYSILIYLLSFVATRSMKNRNFYNANPVNENHGVIFYNANPGQFYNVDAGVGILMLKRDSKN